MQRVQTGIVYQLKITMPAFHIYHNGHIVESVTANTLAAARKYFSARYGPAKVMADPSADEVLAIRAQQAAKALRLVVGARVHSVAKGGGVVVSITNTPNTGVFAVVDFDDGSQANCSAYYLEVQ